MKFITEIHLQDLIHISQYIANLTQKNTYFLCNSVVLNCTYFTTIIT